MRLCFLLSVSLALGASRLIAQKFTVHSPDGRLVVRVDRDASKHLVHWVSRGGREVLLPSPIGVIVDGVDCGDDVAFGSVERWKLSESFPWRGNKSKVEVRGFGIRIPVRPKTGVPWTLELRCFDDGVAYRCILPGRGTRRVLGESGAWVLPEGAVAWCNPDTTNYEGIHERWPVAQIPAERFKNGIGLPVTVELPAGGYALLTEAEVMGYSGMTLERTGSPTLKPSFRDDPGGFTVEGAIRTPWRVLIVTADLDGLVNCDLVPALCAPPSPELFPNGIRTAYLQPGRCLWQWWAYNDPGTHWSRQKDFVDRAAELNCRYYLVDEGWEHTRQQWAAGGISAWDRLKELCDYAAGKGVGIWVWRGWTFNAQRQWPGLETREKRELFFRRCAEVGVKGAKIDFMDSESHDVLAFYEDCLRVAARHGIMVNFHGANKPAGEARTWPNEMTREGVRGLEYNKWSALPPRHYATLPFTRCVVGHGDFTPTTFQPEFLKGTTAAQQLACAVVLTSPVLCWADKPEVYLRSPALNIIRTLPTTWDETRVLSGSSIGELAVLARRSGKDWYVGALNGGKAREYQLELGFLERGRFLAEYFWDVPGEPGRLDYQREVPVSSSSKRLFRLDDGGGFVGHVVRQ